MVVLKKLCVGFVFNVWIAFPFVRTGLEGEKAKNEFILMLFLLVRSVMT